MRKILIAGLAVAALAAALPVIAQIPTVAPGAKDPKRVKAGTYAVDGAHTQILWKVNHLGFNDYYGIFGRATGSLTLDPARPSAASVTIEIPIDSLVVTSDGLKEHLLKPDFFDAAKFTTATFRSTGVVVKGVRAKIAGTLTIKGVTKPVTLDAEFSGAGAGPMSKKDVIGFHAETVIKRSDFGISYGIPLVPDAVPLEITVAFERAG